MRLKEFELKHRFSKTKSRRGKKLRIKDDVTKHNTNSKADAQSGQASSQPS